MHRTARCQFFEQHFGITVDDHQEIVEIMRDAARKAPDGLHFLRLTKLFFELPPVGNVFRDDLQFFRGLFHSADRAAAQAHDNHMSVFALPLHFHAV